MYEFDNGIGAEYIIQGNNFPDEDNDSSVLFESNNNLIEVLLNGRN